MKIVTSISPNNNQRQIRSIESWVKYGYDIVSINSRHESFLKDEFKNIEFIETSQYISIFGKYYPSINAIVDYIKGNGDTLILNSDIEIHGDVKVKTDGLTIFSRNEHSGDYLDSHKFESGFDGFYLTKEIAKKLPKTNLMIGQCHWDYWLPLSAFRLGYKIYSPKYSPLFHESHKVAYGNVQWNHTGKIFAKELGYSGTTSAISTNAHKRIKENIIYI